MHMSPMFMSLGHGFQLDISSYLGPTGIQAAKYSAKAEDKSAPDPAKWQHLRQYLSSQLLDWSQGLLIGLGDQLAKQSWAYMLDEVQDQMV